jgi:molybdate transport system substrate-binding protein
MSAAKRRSFLLAAVLAAATPARADDALTVFAAASLQEAFTEMARAFEQARPGTRVDLQYAGSQVLRTQIEQGARADVFASADLVQTDALHRAGLLAGATPFASNALVVVVPARKPIVTELAHLARPHTKVVTAATSVPAGRYTAELLQRLDASGLHGPQFKLRVLVNVVSQESNVRAVLAKVALGEADAGFVYATDAASAATRVRTLAIPPAVNVPARYAIGVPGTSPRPELGGAFVAFVLAPAGQAILRRHGFGPP